MPYTTDVLGFVEWSVTRGKKGHPICSTVLNKKHTNKQKMKSPLQSRTETDDPGIFEMGTLSGDLGVSQIKEGRHHVHGMS